MRGRTQDDGSRPRTARHDYWGVYLDAPDASTLAQFYSDLLGWPIQVSDAADTGDARVIAASDGVAYLGFQSSPEYVAPVWPAVEGAQQMMAHLDFEVDDLEAASAHAIELGAALADVQPQSNVLVHLDPAGHPFCLYVDARGEG